MRMLERGVITDKAIQPVFLNIHTYLEHLTRDTIFVYEMTCDNFIRPRRQELFASCSNGFEIFLQRSFVSFCRIENSKDHLVNTKLLIWHIQTYGYTKWRAQTCLFVLTALLILVYKKLFITSL